MINPPEIDTRVGLITGRKAEPLVFVPTATNSPSLWEASGLPAGLAIDSSTGKITGKPTERGTFGVAIQASNFYTREFSVNTSTDVLTSSGGNYADGDIVTVSGSLPAPLSASTEYEVRDSTGSTFKLAAGAGGDAINITSTGSGTLTISRKQTDEITIIIPIADSESIDPDGVADEMIVDLTTRQVTVVGMEGVTVGPPSKAEDQKAVFAAKLGDVYPINVALSRNGVPRDITASAMSIVLKEFEPESQIVLTDATHLVKSGSGSDTRHEILLDLEEPSSALLAALDAVEDDQGTAQDLLAELRYELVGQTNEYTGSESAEIELDGTNGAIYMIDFTNLPKVLDEAIVYTFVANLSVPSNSGQQNVQLTVTCPITWNGSTYSAGSITGGTAGEGALDIVDFHWRSELLIESIAADADGVEIEVSVDSAEIASATITVPVSNFQTTTTWSISGNSLTSAIGAETEPLYLDGSGGMHSITIDDGDNAAALKSKINSYGAPYTANEIYDVYLDETNQQIVFGLHLNSTLSQLGTDFTSDHSAVSTNNPTVESTLNVTAAGDGTDAIYKKSSQTFYMLIERDLH